MPFWRTWWLILSQYHYHWKIISVSLQSCYQWREQSVEDGILWNSHTTSVWMCEKVVMILFFSSLLSWTGMQCHINSLAMYHTVQSTHTLHCNFSVENGNRNSRQWLLLVMMCFLFPSKNKLCISHVWPFLIFGSFRIEDRYQKQTAVYDWEVHCRMWRCKVKGFDKEWL
jgi:hypothetical protein